MAEPVDLPFGLWTQVGRRKHEFNRICQVAPMCTVSIVFARWHHCTRRHSAGAVQKWLNQSICHLTCGLKWAEGSTSSINDIRQVMPPRQCAHMGGHIGATRRIRPQRRCSLMSNYSDYLLTHHIKLIKLSALCHFTDYLPLKVFDILSMLFLQYIYFLTIMVTLFISILQCLLIVFNTCLKI